MWVIQNKTTEYGAHIYDKKPIVKIINVKWISSCTY